ncbi:hypothetical protein [Winogradskyella forsetii]|uniref:hypothetical protein n=1 Tax=Winogradskyella forsetii TaxID=2686077 RepID=UPI0015B8470E|nr:hypothetical protein [Winogradskyella forsetii]
MKKTKLILALILLNLIFFSCSSDDDSGNPEPEPTETNKLVKTEKVNDNFKSDYTYNSNDLLATWIGTRTNFGYEINLTYDSNNLLIENDYQETGSGTFSSNTSFTYDSSGNLTNYDDVDLTYNGNIITATGTIEGNANTTIELETNASGQITKLTETDNYTVFGYNVDGNIITAENYDNNDALLTSFNISYDQNENPFYGQMESIYIERFIEFFYPFDGIFISGFEGYSFPYLKNNIVSISENTNSIATYTYTYDGENYPITVDEDYSGNTFQFDIEYFE